MNITFLKKINKPIWHFFSQSHNQLYLILYEKSNLKLKKTFLKIFESEQELYLCTCVTIDIAVFCMIT